MHNERYNDIPIDELIKLQDDKYEYKQYPWIDGTDFPRKKVIDISKSDILE